MHRGTTGSCRWQGCMYTCLSPPGRLHSKQTTTSLQHMIRLVQAAGGRRGARLRRAALPEGRRVGAASGGGGNPPGVAALIGDRARLPSAWWSPIGSWVAHLPPGPGPQTRPTRKAARPPSWLPGRLRRFLKNPNRRSSGVRTQGCHCQAGRWRGTRRGMMGGNCFLERVW